MSLLPVWLEASVAAVICAAAGFGVLSYGHHRYLAAKTEDAAAQAKIDQARNLATIKAAAVALAQRQTVDAKLLEAQNENVKLRAQLDALRASSAVAVSRLQQRIANAERAANGRLPDVPGSPEFSTPVSPIGVALAECAAAYRQLAIDADADHAAGIQCERHADALSGQNVIPNIP